jgi:hypothetical protein
VRLRCALPVALAALALTACGGGSPSPESVARAWSHAINMGDNNAAGDLFAPGAEVVQPDSVRRLDTHADAVAWNASLPCSGRILSVFSRGETVTVTFRLGDRQTSPCDGPGDRVRALFRVHKGKIVLFHQLATIPGSGPSV